MAVEVGIFIHKWLLIIKLNLCIKSAKNLGHTQKYRVLRAGTKTESTFEPKGKRIFTTPDRCYSINNC
ncbi:hypothetical protein THIOM_005738 [Candidatus Thiomargarita nelsonii]|uniref:Uncharacterized protein n=1 Tax=Candidatus Thiomargarita nelsonii TaxID=1003181 RepID=A0A176RSH5_9GAMM|nr:hypothetical protein THIOM_005738 [Candidatus Thiomargarita nelsonii]